MVHTRTLGGIAIGLGVAILTTMSVEAIGNRLFPPPKGYDMSLGDALMLPLETLIWPVIGWFLGALIGAWLAVRISRKAWTGWAIAALVLAATIFNFVLIKHPTWVLIAGAIAPLLGGWIGRGLGSRRTA
jgi:hypothetical protein